MQYKQLLSIVAAGILATTAALAQNSAATVPDMPGLPRAARAAAASIDAEKIRAHVRFLSLDLLEGRGPGTRGGELAAEYIATQFALDGLEPAGDNGTYFQRVPLFAVHTIEDKTKFSFVPASGAARRPRLRHRDRLQGPDRPAHRPTSTRPSSMSATASMLRSTTGTTTPARTARRST